MRIVDHEDAEAGETQLRVLAVELHEIGWVCRQFDHMVNVTRVIPVNHVHGQPPLAHHMQGARRNDIPAMQHGFGA